MTEYLEDQIDAVACQMTSGDRSIDFHARVMAKLDDRRRHPWLWMGGGLVAAAAVVLMVFAYVHDQPAPALTSRPVQPMPDVAEHAQSSTPRLAEARGPVSAEPKRPQAVSVVTTEQLAWESRAVPALEQPEPLSLDDIQPEPLDIRPLVTPPITVPAIGEDEENR